MKTVRALVVDDSGFFRRRLSEILAADAAIEVIGTAADGAEAVRKTAELKPDVITMDVEMPVMDGITAVRRIMATRPTPILMFSSLTHDGAKATLDALDAGALDFLPKHFEEIATNREEACRELCARVRALAHGARHLSATPGSTPAAAPKPAPRAAPARGAHYQLVAIGTSTGGPAALQQVLTRLPADFPLPLLLIQHMPGTFTKAFAERLDHLCAIGVREAADGDALTPGTALLAPGGQQMVVERANGRTVVRIQASPPGQHYKPSVDTTFASAAKVFPGGVLAVVLTGMGADGREGTRLLKAGGSTVWAQDEASCVVYGMPAAVVEAGLADRVLPLAEIGADIAHGV